jgi:hypothetical protein
MKTIPSQKFDSIDTKQTKNAEYLILHSRTDRTSFPKEKLSNRRLS